MEAYEAVVRQAALFKRSHPGLFRLTVGDLVQDAWVKILQAPNEHKDRAQFTTYVVTIARREWITKLRSEIVRKRVQAVAEPPEGSTLAPDPTDAIDGSVDPVGEVIRELEGRNRHDAAGILRRVWDTGRTNLRGLRAETGMTKPQFRAAVRRIRRSNLRKLLAR